MVDKRGFFHGAEGEIRTLAPVNPVYSLSRGAPYSHLGTSANMKFEKMAEMVGFEPTDALTSTVFKTASLNRSDTSPRAKKIVSNSAALVNDFRKVFPSKDAESESEKAPRDRRSLFSTAFVLQDRRDHAADQIDDGKHQVRHAEQRRRKPDDPCRRPLPD